MKQDQSSNLIRKQPISALYFDFETVLKFYNLEARFYDRWAIL